MTTAHLSINIIILFFYVLMFIFNDTTSRIYLAQHINRSKIVACFFENWSFNLITKFKFRSCENSERQFNIQNIHRLLERCVF